MEAFGQAALPEALALPNEQAFRPLVLSFAPLGIQISILLAVDFDSRLVWALSSRRPERGFFFVPTFVGAIGDLETGGRGRVLGQGDGCDSQRRERREHGDQGLAQGGLLLRSKEMNVMRIYRCGQESFAC